VIGRETEIERWYNTYDDLIYTSSLQDDAQKERRKVKKKRRTSD